MELLDPLDRLRADLSRPTKLHAVRVESAGTGITVHELARIMGASVAMIEAHYRTLLDTAHASLLERLEASAGAR